MGTTRTIGMLIFPRMTQLDLTGPAEVFGRMPNTSVLLIAASLEPVRSDRGITIMPTHTYDNCPTLDVLFVPGGPGQQDLMDDPKMFGFLRRQAETAKYITSVCTGSLVLAAAGLLQGYRATSHWQAVDLLAVFGAEPVSERVVIDRNRVTGAGVAAGIDFALTLAAKLEGEEVAKEIQLQIEYDPAPPYRCGSVKVADQSLIDTLRHKGQKLRSERVETCGRAAAALQALA